MPVFKRGNMSFSEDRNLIGPVLVSDESGMLCNFYKLYGAVLTCDEQLAKDWYLNEYCQSCFAVSSDRLRMRKNGFIVLIGYIRSAVISRNKSSAVIMLENTYIRAVENCVDEDGVYRLFVMAFRDFCGRMTEAGEVPQQDTQLKFCTDYIASNLKLPLTLSEIALHCGYNPSYLSRKFKQVYGISIKNYIISEKLKAAAAMLRYSEKSIAEISSVFKFSSQSHFQQEFKKNFKITPLNFRNSFKNK